MCTCCRACVLDCPGVECWKAHSRERQLGHSGKHSLFTVDAYISVHLNKLDHQKVDSYQQNFKLIKIRYTQTDYFQWSLLNILMMMAESQWKSKIQFLRKLECYLKQKKKQWSLLLKKCCISEKYDDIFITYNSCSIVF